MLDFFPLLIGVPNNKLMLQQLPQLNNGFFLLVMSIQTCDMVLVFQSCLTLCSPMDCSLPDSSVLGILQARILEWFAISSSRGSSRPEMEPMSLAYLVLAGGFFTTEPPQANLCISFCEAVRAQIKKIEEEAYTGNTGLFCYTVYIRGYFAHG